VCGNCVTVNGVCRDCMAGRKIGVTEHVDAEKIARKMLEEGLGK
jgi:hypothetical protein